MRHTTKIALSILTCFLLQNCGFEPIHGERHAEKFAGAMPKIEVQVTRGRNEQILKTTLDDRLNPAGNIIGSGDYMLRFDTLTSRPVPVVIEGNATVRRFNVQVSVNFELYRVADNKLLLKGKARRNGSYNASRQFFADYEAQTEASDSAIKELAADMEMRVHAFLLSPPKDYQYPVQPVANGEEAPQTPANDLDWSKKKYENRQ